MPRLLLTGLLATGLLLSGCSGGGSPSADGPSAAPSSGTAGATAPLLSGLDVCGLPSQAMVRTVTGQDGSPTLRSLTRIDGYAGLVDECGFGPSFDSFTFVVAVGLDAVTPKVLGRMPGRSVSGIGDAARAAEVAKQATVTFVTGSTLVQLRAVRAADGPSLRAPLTRVAGALAGKVPPDPPASDDQTSGRCADIDPQLVAGVLGAPSAVSRSLTYQDGSTACSWATGTTAAQTVTVAFYTNRQAGPFLADLKDFGPHATVRGVPGDAFTVPGTAYLVADDGQAVAVSGRFPPAGKPKKPLPVTPALTALLGGAAGLLQ